MQMCLLGDTNLTISRLGLGTVKFGRNEAMKYPKGFALPSDREVTELLGTAKNLGINLLDTAPAYGSSEERLGQLLTDRKSWIIATKIGEEFEQGKSSYIFSPEHAQLSIERSLKKLKTDYLDIVLVHSDGRDSYNIKHFGILDFLQTLKQKGLIRAYGMSTKTVEGGLLALDHSDIAMVTYNPTHTQEKAVIEEAHKRHKGIFIKKAFASGHLEKIHNSDPIQYALDFILKEPGVSSIILGTINPKHLRQNVDCLIRSPHSDPAK